MVRTTNPTHTANIRATATGRGACTAVLTTDQCLAAFRAMKVVEHTGAWRGWLPYVPCIGLPYHGPTPDNRPCPACTLPSEEWRARNEAGTLPVCTCLPSVADGDDPAYLFHCIQQEVEEEFVALTGRHLCPKCKQRQVKHIHTPGPDPYVLRRCTNKECDYEDM